VDLVVDSGDPAPARVDTEVALRPGEIALDALPVGEL
jgi:hypothetical protein